MCGGQVTLKRNEFNDWDLWGDSINLWASPSLHDLLSGGENELRDELLEAVRRKANEGVYVASYGREDGKVTAIKTRSGWVLRSVRGPAWFWNHADNCWVISTAESFDMEDPAFTMTEADALELLPLIADVTESYIP